MASEQQHAVKRLISDAMQLDPAQRVPCIGVHFVSRLGDVLVDEYQGYTSVDPEQSKPLDEQSVFWIASATKIVTTIAVMQLYEERQLDLDSPSLLKTVVPELGKLKVLHGFSDDGEPILEDQQRAITLRMLLTHQAGMSYSFLNEKLWRYIQFDHTKDETHDGSLQGYLLPLVAQPGTEFTYSTSIDWVGVFIERLSGMNLGEYFERFIFQPLGLRNIAFVPSTSMLQNLVKMHRRAPTGAMLPREHLVQATYDRQTGKNHHHSGGGGLFSTLQDYCQILAALLNNGISNKTNKRILNESTVSMIFTNQIEGFDVRFGSQQMMPANKDMVRALSTSEILSMASTDKKGFGLGCMLEGPDLNRSSAPGLANTFWSLDRDLGIAGIISSQVIPMNEPAILHTWDKILALMYAGAPKDPSVPHSNIGESKFGTSEAI